MLVDGSGELVAGGGVAVPGSGEAGEAPGIALGLLIEPGDVPVFEPVDSPAVPVELVPEPLVPFIVVPEPYCGRTRVSSPLVLPRSCEAYIAA